MESIFIQYGRDGKTMAYELMKEANIKKNLYDNMRIVIKPNLVLPDPPENGATTHVEIVEGIICYLQDHCRCDITVAEGSWVGVHSTEKAFDVCGYRRLDKEYGVSLFDTKNDQLVTRQSGNESFSLCKSFEDVDYFINVPVLKGHCQTKLTCCMKNLKGCIPDFEKRRYHSLGLSNPIARLNDILKPDLNIVDSICGDLNFEEGGNPVQSDRILLGFDAVQMDSYCARLIGYNPHEIGYLRKAEEYGIGTIMDEDVKIVELNDEKKPIVETQASSRARKLAKHIDEKSACSACYSALIFALDKTGYRGEKIKIGQDYKGMELNGIGVGSCTNGCEKSLKGCPPTALEVLEFLEKI